MFSYCSSWPLLSGSLCPVMPWLDISGKQTVCPLLNLLFLFFTLVDTICCFAIILLSCLDPKVCILIIQLGLYLTVPDSVSHPVIIIYFF